MELKEQILAKMIETAAPIFGKDPSELGSDTKFEEDLKAKSVNYVQIINVLKDEFDVEIPYLPFKRNQTFEEAADYVADLCDI